MASQGQIKFNGDDGRVLRVVDASQAEDNRAA
jgi:hypothetical protein